MRNEELAMSNETKKNCGDCLHCKVCANSSKGCRLCFCSETEQKERHKEQYWLTKPPCRKFEDMSA